MYNHAGQVFIPVSKMFRNLLVVVALLHTSQCARILGFFPVCSISHQFTFQPIWKNLALRGHQVTVISPNILGENITNLKEIDVGNAYDVINRRGMINIFGKGITAFDMINRVLDFSEETIKMEWDNPEVQKIIHGNDTEYDLILVEALLPLVYALSGKFKVPTVGICSLGATLAGHDAVGNPTHPVISPEMFFDFKGELSFWDRLNSFVYNIYFRVIYNFYWLPRSDKVAKSYFGDDLPYLGDLERNVSMLLLNVNPVFHTVRPNVPAVVEISQMHLKPKMNKLPQNLKQFLDEAKEGFVYFSLGSNIKSANLDPRLRQEILEALGDLPYKVLWKWETDHLPGQPENVKIAKWLPQQEVLALPNIKVFVTQGGIQSIEESLNNAVPMVGIPFAADQHGNVGKLVDKGVAGFVDFTTLTKDVLKKEILEVATNEKYKDMAVELQTLLNDVPMKGLDTAIWWIEYVLRHKGAKHLVSPSRDMELWKYYCIDVIGFILLVTTISIYVISKILMRVFSRKSNRKLKSS